MGRRFDSASRAERRRQRLARWDARLEGVPGRLNALRLRLRRSPNGLALGVFRGIAESLGWSVCWTRVVGCIVLLAISGDRGHTSLLVAGFFYLLAAVLMGRSDTGRSRLETAVDDRLDREAEDRVSQPVPPGFSGRIAPRPAAVPYQQVARAPRVDFAALDRQLDALNRRIQRMEGIVTDRHYDWDRRMES